MRGRVLWSVWLILLLCVPCVTWAQFSISAGSVKTRPISERRVALVIGNAAYSIHGLKNPVNDADAMARTLRQLGFEVLQGTDLNRAGMLNLIYKWGDKLKGAQIALCYYSGHGLQYNGDNYLIPIDADPQEEKQIPDQMVDAGKILAELVEDGSSKANSNIVILDACRSTADFKKGFKKGVDKKGLAEMSPPDNTVIVYATVAGQEASDNADGVNGLYTQELLKHITEPDIAIETILRHTTGAVIRISNGKQTPAKYGTLHEDIYLRKTSTDNESNQQPTTEIIVLSEPVAHIVVTSEPAGATVLIDKKLVGKTPYESNVRLEQEETKTVQVTVMMEGYSPQRGKVPLEVGKSAKIIANLKPKVPEKEPVDFRPSALNSSGNGSSSGTTDLVNAFKTTGNKVHILYVLNTSASLNDANKIGKAKFALEHAIMNLLPDDTFNIITFDRDIHPFQTDLVKASNYNIKRALTYIEGIKANGLTNLSGAMALALGMKSANVMWLMSDGEPEVGIEDFDLLCKFVKARNDHHVVIHTVALSTGTKFRGIKLLEELAKENAGTFRYINLAK